MLTPALARRAIVALAAGVLVAVGIGAPAQASTDDAQQACGASPIDSERAFVPKEVRHSRFLLIPTSKGNYVLNCGDGNDWGAVHIEMKHEVPNWADASTCIAKAIGRSQEDPTQDGKYKYVYDFTGGRVIVIRGDNGIITAFPTGDSVVSKWRICSAS